MIFISSILKEVLSTHLQESDVSRIIYVDLDGVLVDFDRGFAEISSGLNKLEYIEKNGYTAFWNLINQHGEDWWANLEWTSDGTHLWNVLKEHNVKILTSGSIRNTGTFAVNGKRRWVADHLGPIETIVVNNSHDKQKYAKSGDVLIDDLPSNIIEWTGKNGIGILHRNAVDTLEKFNDIIKTV